MVLENIVRLQKGVPAVMHFRSHAVEAVTFTDPKTGRVKTRNRLAFDVDRLNGREVSATFSTLSTKLAGYLEPYLEGNRYTRYLFTIVQRGEDLLTDYEVIPTLWSG